MHDEPVSDNDDQPALPSKSSRKREMTAAQDLGKSLLTLNARQLAALQLPDELLAALKEYRRLPNSNEAKRRQLQFIGKVMRRMDHEAIGEALERLRKPDPAEARRGRCIEQWAERLMTEEGQDAINEFLATHPVAERQVLRQLQRNLLSGKTNARRRLLDYLNDHIGTESPAPGRTP